MTPLRMQLEKWREYSEISEVGKIARRYFAMNAFDGVLTIIGVLMGNLMGGVQDARVVVITGLSTSLAMGVSGLWGSYLTESAERRHDIEELQRQTLTDLQETKIGKASRMAAVIVAIVDGASPFFGFAAGLAPVFLCRVVPGHLLGVLCGHRHGPGHALWPGRFPGTDFQGKPLPGRDQNDHRWHRQHFPELLFRINQ
jgi:predicted membrane protein (TIGR00267 family)